MFFHALALHLLIQKTLIAFLQLPKQDFEKQLGRLRKFVHLSCLIAMIVEYHHSTITSSIPNMKMNLMLQL